MRPRSKLMQFIHDEIRNDTMIAIFQLSLIILIPYAAAYGISSYSTYRVNYECITRISTIKTYKDWLKSPQFVSDALTGICRYDAEKRNRELFAKSKYFKDSK